MNATRLDGLGLNLVYSCCMWSDLQLPVEGSKGYQDRIGC